jgi:hypothetical protein
MKAYPAVGWKVGYVNRHDAEHPDQRRPARVLLQREGIAGWLLPVSGDHLRIFGYVLPEDTFELEPEQWIPCEGSPAWVLGKSPVVTGTTPLTLEFVDPLEATRRRRNEASQAILSALVSSRDESLLDRASDLEHADRILNGNPVSVAALLALSAEEASINALELDSPERLRDRLITVAPSGLDKLRKEMQKPGFDLVRADRKLHDSLLTAASTAFSSTTFVVPGKWSTLRSTTLWSWWLRSKMAAEKAPLPRMASSLKLPLKDLEALARGDAPPRAEILARLPSAIDALAEVTGRFEVTPDLQTVAFIAEAHQPRLDLMAAQMGELERQNNDTRRLVSWERQREPLRDIAAQMALQEDGLPWIRARGAADRVRREVFQVGAEDPIPLVKLLEGVAAHLVATRLPFERLLGEWTVGLGAPIVVLGPSVLAGDVGVLRFAVAHQIGHLLDSVGHASASRCAFIAPGDDDRAETDPGEAFANAFAAYLLAPRDAVIRLIGTPSNPTVDWLFGAARDVAFAFGLSAGGALYHVLNCLRVWIPNVKKRVHQARTTSGWQAWRSKLRGEVENAWTSDHATATSEVGELPGELDPLGRPRSAFFDRLVSEATLEGLLTPEAAAELNAA